MTSNDPRTVVIRYVERLLATHPTNPTDDNPDDPDAADRLSTCEIVCRVRDEAPVCRRGCR